MKKFTLSVVFAFALFVSPTFAQATTPLPTTRFTESQIQSVLALLNSFGVDGGTAEGVKVPLTGAKTVVERPAFCYNFNSNLTVGSAGEAVTALGKALRLAGISTGGERFDEDTAASVVMFQAKYGIRQTGYVGPITRKKLNALHSCGGRVVKPQPWPPTKCPSVVLPACVGERIKNEKGCVVGIKCGTSEPVSAVTFTASPTSGPAPLTVKFTSVGPNAMHATIDFGDERSSGPCNDYCPETFELSHTYTSVGTYIATLKKNRTQILGTTTITVTATGTTGAPTTTSNTTSPLGSNVGFFADWVSEIMLKDVGRRIRDFSCSPSPCTLDANGWPIVAANQKALTNIFTAGSQYLSGKYPTGTYHVFYDGTGKIEYNGVTPNAYTPVSSPNHDVVDVTSNSAGFGYTITSSSPSPNHIRNIRVIIPGGDCGDIFVPANSASDCPNPSNFRPNNQTYIDQPFYSRFLVLYRPYKAIRYLNFTLNDQGKQGSVTITTPRPWSARLKMTDAIWLRRGVPIELVIQLSNTLHADPWLNIPHLANDLISDNPSDPYVKQLATYVRDNLNPDLKAYVEYSNEVWNGIFESSRYAIDKGQELGLGMNDNGQSDQYLGGLRYQSQQSVKLFKIWNDVYGGRSPRIVRVIAAQSVPSSASIGEPYPAKNLLDWKDAYKETDAFAFGAYFGTIPTDEATVATYSLDQFFSYINEKLLPRTITAIKDNAAAAKKRGLEPLVYEGGQHFTESPQYQKNTALNSLYDTANRDKRMGDVYKKLLVAWRENGGHLFMHFINVGQYMSGTVGRFGALESMLQDPATSPKYQALMDFIKNNPKWW